MVSTRNLQTSRGLRSGGKLLVSGRVAEKRATLRKTNAACEKWCFGRLIFLWVRRSICRGLYEFRGSYCSIIISYHIRIISQRGVRDSPLDEIECYLVPKHPRTFLFFGFDWNPESYSREGPGFLGQKSEQIPLEVLKQGYIMIHIVYVFNKFV